VAEKAKQIKQLHLAGGLMMGRQAVGDMGTGAFIGVSRMWNVRDAGRMPYWLECL